MQEFLDLKTDSYGGVGQVYPLRSSFMIGFSTQVHRLGSMRFQSLAVLQMEYNELNR